MDNYLKNLPKSDNNEELQQLSIKALKSVLPTDKFLLRDERVDDKGVDFSLEVKHEKSFTNFRSQVQLKATSSSKMNNDGGVSYSVKTSNFNYLLNNPISIYILYIESQNEFRFVWVRDEHRRLLEENPKWNEQENISLRFSQVLNEPTFSQIHQRIIKEGSLFRRINETLTNDSEGNLKIETVSSNLKLTTQEEAKKILDFYGLELLNTGYENFVLEKYELLAGSQKKRTKFLLLKSRAEGLLGNYRTSLDTLGIIESNDIELSPIEKFHFESIENHSNWMLGNIDTEQFLKKLEELSKDDLVKDSILDRFNFLHFSLMYGNPNIVDNRKFLKRIKKLEKIGEEIIGDKNFSQEVKVYVEFSILESKLKWLILEQTFLAGEAAIYEMASVYVAEHWDRKKQYPLEVEKWVVKTNELLAKTHNPTTQADISYLQIRLWFHQNQSRQFWAINKGEGYFIDEETSKYFIEKLKSVIIIYNSYSQTYSIIRAKMLMVELLSLLGKSEEAEILRKQINKRSKAMSYEPLKNLTQFSLHKSLFDYASKINLEES